MDNLNQQVSRTVAAFVSICQWSDNSGINGNSDHFNDHHHTPHDDDIPRQQQHSNSITINQLKVIRDWTILMYWLVGSDWLFVYWVIGRHFLPEASIYLIPLIHFCRLNNKASCLLIAACAWSTTIYFISLFTTDYPLNCLDYSNSLL